MGQLTAEERRRIFLARQQMSRETLTRLSAPVAAWLRFGQGHSIRHWAQGGLTTLSNLALLCRRHHRAVHEGATSSIDSLTASFGSAARTGGLCPRCRLLWRCSAIPSRSSKHSTMLRGLS